jgi:hypothetical protein
MSGSQEPNKHLKSVKPVVPQSDKLEQFLKLQQSQEEFLAWLESSEKQRPDHDNFFFKKIR